MIPFGRFVQKEDEKVVATSAEKGFSNGEDKGPTSPRFSLKKNAQEFTMNHADND